MDNEPLGRSYLDHLTDADLELLVTYADTEVQAGELRYRPEVVPELLTQRVLFDRVYGRPLDRAPEMLDLSPFLAFALAVHRAGAELAGVSHLPEVSGTRQRVPLFDVPQLSDFLAGPMRRLFLAELLASFARVSSGRYWVKTARGWRPRRYSELDPVRLAGLVDSLPEAERPGVYRRLGDLALFLSGVFPDYVHMHAFRPVDAARLLRSVDASVDEDSPPIQLLEHLGQRWYENACVSVRTRSAQIDVVAEVAERFQQARRVLNHIAENYLFRTGYSWF